MEKDMELAKNENELELTTERESPWPGRTQYIKKGDIWDRIDKSLVKINTLVQTMLAVFPLLILFSL